MKKKQKREIKTQSSVVQHEKEEYTADILSIEGKKRKKKKLRKKRVIIAVSVLLAVVILLVTAVSILLNSRLFLDKEEGKLPEGLLSPPNIRAKQMNILIMGIDKISRDGKSRAGTLTDVVMIANYDIVNKKVNILQIPRDTYIGDDYSTSKINAIYGSKKNGGIKGLAKRINEYFDIPIDHYVTLDIDGLVSLVDTIGGIKMNVPVSFTSGNNIHIKKGYQTINGAQWKISD